MEIFKRRQFYIAVLITLACASLGSYLANFPGLSMVGSLVIALILGMLLQAVPAAKSAVKNDVGFISNKLLRLGIILLGFKLNLITLAHAGVKTILLAVIVVTGMITLTYWVARKLGVSSSLAILTASGTGICGAAAVMGISPQIQVGPGQAEKKREDEVLAIAIVAILGTVFTLIEILIKPLLHFTPTQFGVMAGGSLHEIAHAVAAGSSVGPVGLNEAIIMKLSRVLLLAPAALIIGIWYQKAHPVESGARQKLPIPWFMGGFILASIVGTFLSLPAGLIALLVKAAYIFLGMAMAALGLSVNFRVIVERGHRPFLAATMISVVLMLFTMTIAKFMF